MTREQFKKRWESNDNGGGLTFDDVAECAKEWGIAPRPRTMLIATVTYRVLKAAKVTGAEEFKP